MFTGIVEEIGKVRVASPGQLTVYAQKVLGETKLGDSVAVNGVFRGISMTWADCARWRRRGRLFS